jgi:hypothetical protein
MSDSPGLLARTLRIFRERPFLFIAIAALPYFTVHLIFWWLLFSSPAMQIAPGESIRDKFHSLTDAQLALFMVTMLLWATLPYALAGRGLCRAASRQIENLPVSFGEIAMDIMSFLPSALLLSLIIGLATVIGMGAFLLPGLFIDTFFTLVIPAGAIEKLSPFAALGRGLKMAGRTYGKLLGLYLCFGLTVVVAFILQAVLLGNLPRTAEARISVVILMTCIPIVPLAIYNICLTLIFLEARDLVSRSSGVILSE